MISGMTLSPISTREAILSKMADNTWNIFYLTGSRFFGTHKENSDFDFYTDQTECVEFLAGLGFEELPLEMRDEYLDNYIGRVYRHSSGIDVQLYPNAEVKRVAQEIIKEYRLLYWLDKPLTSKSAIRSVWNRAMDLAEKIVFLK